jgi:hypothetical protein
MAEKSTTLYSPAGEKYVTSSRAEVTRLKAQGYSEKKPTPKQVEANTGQAK